MKSKFIKLFTGLLFFTLCSGANAVSLNVNVYGVNGPWNPVINPNYDYNRYENYDQNTATIINNIAGKDLNAGDKLIVNYLSGKVIWYLNAPEFHWVDANGYEQYITNDLKYSDGVNRFPSAYINPDDYPIYLMALLGTFTDSSGIIIDNPFFIGTNPLELTVPVGATQLQLGVNDCHYSSNEGYFLVNVEHIPAPVPEPSSMVLGLISLAGFFGTKKLKSVK